MFPRKTKDWHSVHVASEGTYLHEMSNIFSGENKKQKENRVCHFMLNVSKDSLDKCQTLFSGEKKKRKMS